MGDGNRMAVQDTPDEKRGEPIPKTTKAKRLKAWFMW
jgi:hypothetical protein